MGPAKEPGEYSQAWDKFRDRVPGLLRPRIVYRSDEEHFEVEQRDIAIGVAGGIAVLFVVNTIRGDEEQEIIRIISARPATKAEKREYARVNGAAEA